MTSEERLNDYIKGLLQKHFDKTKDQIQLCVCEKCDGTTDWKCLSGKPNTRKKLGSMLSKMGQLENAEKIENSEWVLWCDQKSVWDSRIDGGGCRKDILIVFCGSAFSESLQLISAICAKEILDKLKDLLYLEQFELTNNWEEREKTSVRNYFFGNLEDKDWLVRRYVKQALENNMLPGRSVFMQISAMLYEKRPVETRMYFYNELDDKVSSLMFDSSKNPENVVYRLNEKDLRNIRKLMELSGAGHGLLVKMQKPHYIIEGIAMDSKALEDRTFVKFEKQLVWKLNKGKETIFEYYMGEYKFPELEAKDNVEAQLNKLDTLPLTDDAKNKIRDTINGIIKKVQHGTSIVFMDGETLGKELLELSSYQRTLPIAEVNLQEVINNFGGVLAIDGALLADTDCNCYAVGAIVEAELITPGRIDRGARYNSLVNYVHAVSKKEGYGENSICFSVIISVDETIDVEVPTYEA